ncbi:MAG: hypothetical protein IPK87_00830 [Planctomycetes bacterium]|nr:hypothetical protein [Planctomycetota bacterium]
MRIEFRTLDKAAYPAPGEIIVQHGLDVAGEHLGLATVVQALGVAALPHGKGDPALVVVPLSAVSPSFDHLLAAEYAQRLIAGETLPPWAAIFAKYAGLVREGLSPTALPVADTLEAFYLAVLNSEGANLKQPSVAEKFLFDWRRLYAAISKAGDDGVDPFKTAFLAGNPQFSREHAFLLHDRSAYLQDVARGERWIARIPGGPASSSALILQDPKSLLFKFWARSDNEAPTGDMYLLLAVNWGRGKWVFSTDPVQRIPLRDLAAALRRAEQQNDPLAAGKDPWDDGAEFNYTLVSSASGRTRLSDEQVLKVLRTWCAGQPRLRTNG